MSPNHASVHQRWKRVRIGDSVRLVNGAAFKPIDWTENGIPIVRIQNLNNPEASFNRTTRELPEKFKLRGGELLFAWSGTPGTSFGAHIWRGEEAWLNQHIFNVHFDEKEWDKRFLRFAINQNLAEYIRAAHGGAGLAHITKGRFEGSELLQPPLSEQRRIVAEIETQFTRLDAGVAALRRTQANLKRYRAAVLKAACEGRLVPTEAELRRTGMQKVEVSSPGRPEDPRVPGSIPTADFDSASDGSNPCRGSTIDPDSTPGARKVGRYVRDVEVACSNLAAPTEKIRGSTLSGCATPDFESGALLLQRILTERRRNWQGRGEYKEPSPPNTTNLGPLPEGWTWATFEQLSERVTVGFVGSMKHEYVERGIPFLRGQNVRENRFDPEGLLNVSLEFHQKLSKSALRPGDLAVVRSGSVGVTCVIPDSLPEANCSDLVLVQRPLGFVPQYGAYYMNSLAKRHVAAGKVGVALIHFNTKSVAALAVPLPPIAEQARIVAEVERRLSVLDELQTVVNADLQRATRLRQSILQKAFSGTLS